MGLEAVIKKKLSETPPDIAGLVDALFAAAVDHRYLGFGQEENRCVAFKVPGIAKVQVPVPDAESVLRATCTYLNKLAYPSDSASGSRDSFLRTGRYGTSLIRIECENSPGRRWFILTLRGELAAPGDAGCRLPVYSCSAARRA